MTGTSNLAGTWYVLEGQIRSISSDGKVYEESVRGGRDAIWVIREDGSLGFECMILKMAGRVDKLRKKGDRINSPTNPGGYVKVIESRYTPNMSKVVQNCHNPTYQTVTMSFEVKMDSDSSACLQMVTEQDDGKGITTLRLARSDKSISHAKGTVNKKDSRKQIDYAWCEDHLDAEQKARREKRYLFIFYKHWLDETSNRMHSEVLTHPKVVEFFKDTINVILDKDQGSDVSKYMTKYEVNSTPAFVIVSPNGRYQVRQGFIPIDKFVSFISETMNQSDKTQ
jgi:thioredoxin-related protein